MAEAPARCCFCSSRFRSRPPLRGEPWDTVLAAGPDWTVVPTKGALVPGWVLLVSTDHELCFGAVSDRLADSLMAGLREAVGVVERAFGQATVFEHGPRQPGTPVGCGVDHLHLHVAPLGFSLTQAATSFFPAIRWRAARTWGDLRMVHAQGVPYLAVEEPGRPLLWCPAPRGVRQPLRRVIAAAEGRPLEFDYSAHPQPGNVAVTLGRLGAV